MDEGQTFFHVTYDDFDQQDLDLEELLDSVVYHPELDTINDAVVPTLPEVDTVVLFAADQEPRLGRVMEIQPQSQKPVVIQLLKPHRGSRNLTSAKYIAALSDGLPDSRALTPMQIRLTGLSLNEAGYLTTECKPLMTKALREWTTRT